MLIRMFKMVVTRPEDDVPLVTRETSDISGVLDACERWDARGYEVKLYRLDKIEIDWKGC